MDAAETIEHFENMGVLDNVVMSLSGKILAIEASATDGYAFRCMRDFATTTDHKTIGGIEAETDDGVPVIMRFLGGI